MFGRESDIRREGHGGADTDSGEPLFGDGEPIYARKLSAYTAIDLGVEYRYNARLSLGLNAKGPLGDTEIIGGYGAQNMGIMMLASYRF